MYWCMGVRVHGYMGVRVHGSEGTHSDMIHFAISHFFIVVDVDQLLAVKYLIIMRIVKALQQSS